MSGWNHKGCFNVVRCDSCGNEFKPNSGAHRFCSVPCKGRWKYISGQETTAMQYGRISGNWQRYFCRLRVRSTRQAEITVAELFAILKKQNNRCALSGVVLTCLLEKGKKFHTNASIDRIEAGGSYRPENVQLVCAVLNKFRANTAVDEFVEWCRKVAEYNEKKKLSSRI